MENENRITIPDFSKDDFLISSKPFQWIIDQADGNEFIKGQLVAQMADKAKELDVSNFRTQFKNYVRAQKGQSIVYGNVMEFSGTAIMWDTGEWIATDDGVYRFKGQFSEKVTAWGINSAELRGSGMRRILKHPKFMIQLPVHVMATKNGVLNVWYPIRKRDMISRLSVMRKSC